MKNEIANNSSQDYENVTALIYKLCRRVTGLSPDLVTPHYQLVLHALDRHSSQIINRDEFQIIEKVKKQLVRSHREKDAVYFAHLCRKLETDDVLKNRWAILCFLMHLNDSKNSHVNKSSTFCRSLAIFSRATASNSASVYNNNNNQVAMGGSCPSTIKSALSSRNSDCRKSSGRNLDTLPLLHNVAPNNPVNEVVMTQPQKTVGSRVARVAAMFSSREQHTDDRVPLLNDKISSEANSVPSPIRFSANSNKFTVRREILESEILRELVYIFQGIEGTIIKFDVSKDIFVIDSYVSVQEPIRKLILRLAELGWLYQKVRNFCDKRSSDRALGLVGQSFVASLQQELTEYYRLLAVLEAQLHLQETKQSSSSGSSSQSGLTLRRMMVWTMDPMARLKALSLLVDSCKGLKGGALASKIYFHLQNGDPIITEFTTNILAQVVQPLYLMLKRWIFDGELEDNFCEFFVEANTNIADDKLWHERYTMKKSMVPAFISLEQARKILLIGKSINFIRKVCKENLSANVQDHMESLDNLSVESLFTQDVNEDFQKLIDTTYEQTSRCVLDIMQTRYKFFEHMQAMRRYLLLGQGDFIRHLIDLLEPDLIKPVETLYLHNMSGILEMAVRATNAQFEDPDILKRIDVQFLEVSPGDTGWNVFSLDYHVDGPIGTIFTPHCMPLYLRLFNHLWRSKRMEYILSSMWKEQMYHSRLLKEIPELGPAKFQCYILSSEMVHFVQQIQYYITFEVMECSWDTLVKKVRNAKDLDHVVAAHEEFLDTVLARLLLDEESEELLNQLRTIYDLIIQFQIIQNNLWEHVNEELLNRRLALDSMNANTKKGKWGTNEGQSLSEKQRQMEFIKKFIPTIRSQLRILSTSYQEMVSNFLIMLTNHVDINLQFLSFRLDFNEHYKNKNSILRSSLTYQHRRKSQQPSRSNSLQFLA